jgi:peptidoglycan hydrolase-like protein with peptidoglycan-binding domain
MKTLKTMRIALLVAGISAISVSPLHAVATAGAKHKKSSSAKSSRTPNAKASTSRKSSSAADSGTPKSLAAKSVGATSVKGTSVATKSLATKSPVSKSRGISGKHQKSTGRQRGQMAPTPERITEIQQALAKNGALAGEPSGKWDDSTSDAMRKFQAAHGLNPSGKLDAPTLNQLGLGSATAGVAPPTPMVRTSSVKLPADIQQ